MPVRFRNVDKKYWEAWLPTDFGVRIKGIRDSVKRIHKEIEGKYPPLPFYTPHGVEHLNAVENNLHFIIPEDKHEALSESEKFFLLGGAWLHDLGMLRGIFPSEDENKDAKSIRDDHHTRSEQYIVENWGHCNIYEHEAAAFSLLAKFHRRRCNLSECCEKFEVPEHGTIRLRLLAAYLRLADALHIDVTRTPSGAYAICLSYDIPASSKLHWIKSKFVLGIDTNIDEHTITVHLRDPLLPKNSHTETAWERRLNSIYALIMDDLKAELNSVQEILVQEGITYFLKVKQEIHKVQIDQQLNIDLQGLINNFDILAHPSSSALLDLVLDTVQGILEAKNNTNGHAEMQVPNQAIIPAQNFLEEIEKNVLVSRQCHSGLKVLVNSLKELLKKPQNATSMLEEIKDKRKAWKNNRQKLRQNAREYFSSQLNQGNGGQIPNHSFNLENEGNSGNNVSWNFLVYGYSSLVIKAICGFRDAVVQELLQKYVVERNNSNTILHKAGLEEKASKHFRLFVCEAQPKTQTAWGGRMTFHDGTQYAIKFKQYGFNNVYVIPDAIAGSLIARNKFSNTNGNSDGLRGIDYVLIGTNGFDNDTFKHSAGHSMITMLAKCPNVSDKSSSPKVILTTTIDKYAEHAEASCCEADQDIGMNKNKTHTDDKYECRDGWLIKGPFGKEHVRKNIFISQDPELRQTLFDEKVSFYNPREDTIPIKNYLDVVITDNAYVPNPENGDQINKTTLNENQETVSAKHDCTITAEM